MTALLPAVPRHFAHSRPLVFCLHCAFAGTTPLQETLVPRHPYQPVLKVPSTSCTHLSPLSLMILSSLGFFLSCPPCQLLLFLKTFRFPVPIPIPLHYVLFVLSLIMCSFFRFHFSILLLLELFLPCRTDFTFFFCLIALFQHHEGVTRGPWQWKRRLHGAVASTERVVSLGVDVISNLHALPRHDVVPLRPGWKGAYSGNRASPSAWMWHSSTVMRLPF